MAFIDQLRPLMCHEVTWEPWVSVDRYDAPSYSSPQSLTCYVVGNVQMIRSVDGREVVSNTTVYFDGVPGVTTKDRVTLPDGSTPKILKVTTYADETGDQFQEILL